MCRARADVRVFDDQAYGAAVSRGRIPLSRIPTLARAGTRGGAVTPSRPPVDTWWVRLRGDDARVRLLCLPSAGAGAAAYARWPELGASAGIQVLSARLPGRETRMAERPWSDIDQMVTALAAPNACWAARWSSSVTVCPCRHSEHLPGAPHGGGGRAAARRPGEPRVRRSAVFCAVTAA